MRGFCGWYRSRHGIFFGLCRGLGEYFDFSVFWIQFMVVVALMVTGIWPMAGLKAAVISMVIPLFDHLAKIDEVTSVKIHGLKKRQQIG